MFFLYDGPFLRKNYQVLFDRL